MEIQTRKQKEAMIVSIKGRMDALTAPEFENNLSGHISQGENIFIINFVGLEYISSAGLRSILAISKKLKEKNGKMLLTGLHGSVEEVFRISGFKTIFTIYATEEAAFKEI
jgi:anti-anti-sigma factor